ncbi:UNVERIFIED_CONTAM: hypothetical protein GTU68_018245 [Idotea baltica]|nr:hypothetical protein [Idotea baltica]
MTWDTAMSAVTGRRSLRHTSTRSRSAGCNTPTSTPPLCARPPEQLSSLG